MLANPHNGVHTVLLSAICRVQQKPRFIYEESTSPQHQTKSKVRVCPLMSATTRKGSQTDEQTSFPEVFLGHLCRISLVLQTVCCSGPPGGWWWWSRTWRCCMWRSWSGVVRRGLWGRLDVMSYFWKAFGDSLWWRNGTFWQTALVDIPAVSMTIWRSHKPSNICGCAGW